MKVEDNPLRDLNNARNLPKDAGNLPSDTPETDAEAMYVGMGHFMVDADFARKLERERDELVARLEAAQTLQSAVDVIMAAPIPDILRLFRERGILASMTTTAKEGAK